MNVTNAAVADDLYSVVFDHSPEYQIRQQDWSIVARQWHRLSTIEAWKQRLEPIHCFEEVRVMKKMTDAVEVRMVLVESLVEEKAVVVVDEVVVVAATTTHW